MKSLDVLEEQEEIIDHFEDKSMILYFVIVTIEKKKKIKVLTLNEHDSHNLNVN